MMEVLLAILIFSIGFVSFAAVLGQVLKITSKNQHLIFALLKYEELLFELEDGERSDLVAYGGKGVLDDDVQYEIQSDAVEGSCFAIKMRMIWRKGKDYLNFDLLMPGASIQ